MELTIHQWIVVGVTAVIFVFCLLSYLAPLAQLVGGYGKALGMLFLGLVVKLGPFALLIYGVWAFFVEPRL